MYLAEIALRNFRSCADTTIHLHKALTILVGENNGGKTSVIDAIRLLTTPSDGRRTRYPELRDIYRDEPTATLSIDARFEELSPTQKGWFLTALKSPAESTALLGYYWTPPAAGVRRARPTLTVGRRRSVDPEPATRELIRHVHLPALRDAERDLASSAPGRIEFLLRHIMGPDAKTKEAALLELVKDAFDKVMKADDTLKSASEKVADEFDPLTDGFHPHKARLAFADATLVGLASDLRFRLSQRGVDLNHLAETGLGYANLLYLASVLVELAAAKDADLTLLLVEEPEAHLHPQLQAVTLELLHTRARESQEREVEPGHRAGRIQVIVSTHSPNLASAVSCEHVVVLRSEVPQDVSPSASPSEQLQEHVTAEDVDPSSASAPTRSAVTQAVAVSRLRLPPPVLRKIDRYLDVTRSNMLFSRRVLLVEGLAEALLVPVFARQLFGNDRKKLNRFRATTIVAIDGVDFEPFVRLLLQSASSGGPTIAERVAVITDDDSRAPAGDETHSDDDDDEDEYADVESGTTADTKPAGEKIPAGVRRQKHLADVAEEIGAGGRLKTLVTQRTFEHALVSHCFGNTERLSAIKNAYSNMLKQKAAIAKRKLRFESEVETRATPDDSGDAFMTYVNKKSFRKGDFAQLLAAEIEPPDAKSRSFGAPPPFKEALEWLVEL